MRALTPCALAALALLAAVPAEARPPLPPHARARTSDPACRRDARELCRDRERGESVLDCLLASRPDLSEGCRASLDAPRLSRADLRDCREDTRDYCRRQRGHGLAACLVRHKADLTEDCRDAVEEAQRAQGLLPEEPPKKENKGKKDPKEKPEKKGKKAAKDARGEDDGAGDGGDDDGTAGDAEAGPETPER